MKELTKKQILLVGLAISKTIQPNNKEANFNGVYESTAKKMIPICIHHWDDIDARISIEDIARHLPMTEAAYECDSKEAALRKQIKHWENEAIAAYPCEYDETRKYIQFGTCYSFECGRGEARCIDGVTKIDFLPEVRYGDKDSAEVARYLMDFYTHPADPQLSETFARNIEDCYNGIYTTRANKSDILIEDFIESGRCSEALKAMGLEDEWE